MTQVTIDLLLDLNRRFYATVGPDFDQSRQGLPLGLLRTLEHLPHPGNRPLRVLDVGCGNGRLARGLAQLGRAIDYVGTDADAALLKRAARQTAGLVHVKSTFVRSDLADPAWHMAWDSNWFDVAFCLSTIHHFPSLGLRARILVDIVNLTKSGDVIIGTWQYQNSPRLVARIQPWSAIGLTPDDVEPGDALLPWDQGVHALRYVHAVGMDEIAAATHACRLRILDSYLADGATGTLNLYAVIGP